MVLACGVSQYSVGAPFNGEEGREGLTKYEIILLGLLNLLVGASISIARRYKGSD